MLNPFIIVIFVLVIKMVSVYNKSSYEKYFYIKNCFFFYFDSNVYEYIEIENFDHGK